MVEHGTPPGKFFSQPLGKHLDEYTRDRFEKVYRSFRPGDSLVVISNYIRSVLPADVAAKGITIYNGADHFPMASVEKAKAFRERLSIRDGDIMVLWVGRIEPENDGQPYKGLRELVEITPLLMSSDPRIRVVAVGRAEESARIFLERYGIIPLLNLPNDDMPSCYAAADIFINTSRWEGFNLALVEAQFQGTPAVAYDICAHPEVLLNGYSGLLVSTPEDLIKVILALASNHEYRAILATGARKMSLKFTWDSNADQLSKLIDECYGFASASPVDIEMPTEPHKNLNYYVIKARNIYRREGLNVLLRELKGTIYRRFRHAEEDRNSPGGSGPDSSEKPQIT
jgi:glycosyltransferase involved in cell wall biosynthesis